MQSLAFLKDFQPGAKTEACLHGQTPGVSFYFLKDIQKLSVCSYACRQQCKICCPPPNKAERQFGPNQPCFLLLQGLQACWSHAAEQVFLKFWMERPSLQGWWKTVSVCHPPLSSCLRTKSVEFLYYEQHPGVEIICLQQEICSLSYMWLPHNQVFLLPTTDSVFLVMIFICFMC